MRDRGKRRTNLPSGEKIVVRPIQKRPVLGQDGPSTTSASHALSYLLACGAGRRRISSRTNEAGCAHAYHRFKPSSTDTDLDDDERVWRGGRGEMNEPEVTRPRESCTRASHRHSAVAELAFLLTFLFRPWPPAPRLRNATQIKESSKLSARFHTHNIRRPNATSHEAILLLSLWL